MATGSTLEARLAAVESALADLQRRLPAPQGNWLDQVIGSFKDEPAFDEVIAYGREVREADRPREDEEE